MTSQIVVGAAALATAAAILYLGRRDLTRPAVAFGAIWFGFVAVAQLRLTEVETPWPTGFVVLVFAGGLVFVLASVLAGGTERARGRLRVDRDEYRVGRLVAVAVVLLLGGIAGIAYKAHVLGGIPLLSDNPDAVRGRATLGGVSNEPAWSTALTNGFYLSAWCALAALWMFPPRWSMLRATGLWLLVLGGFFGVSLEASRNLLLFALAVPMIAAYLLAHPPRRRSGLIWVGAGAVVVALVVGGLFVSRLAQADNTSSSFLKQELKRQPLLVRPFVPFYINGVFPLEAASRVYRSVPAVHRYGLGADSVLSMPNAFFPEGKPLYGAEVAAFMQGGHAGGLYWSVASYVGRLYSDLGREGVLLGSLLLGLGFGGLFRWARSKSGFVAVAVVAYVAYYSAYMVYDNLLSFTVIAVWDLAVITAVARIVRGDADELVAAIRGLRIPARGGGRSIRAVGTSLRALWRQGAAA